MNLLIYPSEPIKSKGFDSHVIDQVAARNNKDFRFNILSQGMLATPDYYNILFKNIDLKINFNKAEVRVRLIFTNFGQIKKYL